jgi:hypothetical protein
MSEQATERALPPARHETDDVTPRLIAGLLLLAGALLLLLIGLAFLMFPAEVKDARFTRPFPAWPEPSLQASPRADMGRFYAAEMQHLNSAGWQDRAAGTVHIPIDQAMRAVAAEGIPGWPTGTATGTAGAAQADRR